MIKSVSDKTSIDKIDVFLGFFGEVEPKLTENYSENRLSSGDDAIKVQVLFNTEKTLYQIKEIATSVKVLTPVREKKTMSEKVMDYAELLKPVLDTAKGIIPGPLSVIVNAVSRIKYNSLAPESSKWYVKSITTENMHQGIELCISKNAVKNLGNRITGSIAVVFIKSLDSEKNLKKEITVSARTILKYKRLMGNREIILPGKQQRNGVHFIRPARHGPGTPDNEAV